MSSKPLYDDDEIQGLCSMHYHKHLAELGEDCARYSSIGLKSGLEIARSYYEDQRAKQQAEIDRLREGMQRAVDAIDSLQNVDNGCPLPTWKNAYDKAQEQAQQVIDDAEKNFNITPR